MPRGKRKLWYLPPWGVKPYSVSWYRNERVEGIETEEPAALEPLKDPDFNAVRWELYDREGRQWFSLSIVRDSVTAGRVHRLFVGVDEYYAFLRSMTVE